jgi:hypothetical protein
MRIGSVAKVVIRGDVATEHHLAEPVFGVDFVPQQDPLLCRPSRFIEPSGLAMQVL